MYGITGGIPHYINKPDVRGNLNRALPDNLFDPAACLFEEPSNLLKQELREPALYNAIITAIAEGHTRMSEIASRVGMESSVCSKYVSVLLSLGILGRATPVTEKSGRKTVYRIRDPFSSSGTATPRVFRSPISVKRVPHWFLQFPKRKGRVR